VAMAVYVHIVGRELKSDDGCTYMVGRRWKMWRECNDVHSC
jgi:hypothetical protein